MGRKEPTDLMNINVKQSNNPCTCVLSLEQAQPDWLKIVQKTEKYGNFAQKVNGF